MNRWFADTHYFFALLNKQDLSHPRAAECSKAAGQLVTTEWVLTELADGLALSPQRDIFVEFRKCLYSDKRVRVEPLSMELQEAGVRLFASRADKEWSLTDCISFEVMQREGLSEALTGDRHFEQAGFVALLK